jgi:tryptophan synthase alpha chain
MTSRYDALFDRLREKREGAFVPFVMLGDPNADESAQIIETLAHSGADALELGIPFSDPTADGPVIQTAADRALTGGATPDTCLGIVKKFRDRHDAIPIGLLVYANIVMGRGAERFYERAAKSGVDSVLVADVPTLSASSFVKSARGAGVAPVFIVPPNADDAKLREIAGLSEGYTYFLGRAGVTGADKEMTTPAERMISLLKSAGAPPVVVGFGISRPEHVRASLETGADGAIAGSATVAIVERHLDDRAAMHKELAGFARDMKAATISRLQGE